MLLILRVTLGPGEGPLSEVMQAVHRVLPEIRGLLRDTGIRMDKYALLK